MARLLIISTHGSEIIQPVLMASLWLRSVRRVTSDTCLPGAQRSQKVRGALGERVPVDPPQGAGWIRCRPQRACSHVRALRRPVGHPTKI